MKPVIFLIFFLYTLNILNAQNNIKIFINNNNTIGEKNVQFNITLPNNDIIKVNISFEMLYKNTSDKHNPTTTTTTYPINILPEITTESPIAVKSFTTQDAINAFTENLLKKESDIGGILNATAPFDRHFNLMYKTISLPIRCTYISNYTAKTLKITCNEYVETQYIERLNSNGEIEIVKKEDNKRVEQIIINEDDVNSYTQTYKMVIT